MWNEFYIGEPLTTLEKQLELELKDIDEKIDQATRDILEVLFNWDPKITEDVQYKEFLLNKYLKN